MHIDDLNGKRPREKTCIQCEGHAMKNVELIKRNGKRQKTWKEIFNNGMVLKVEYYSPKQISIRSICITA